MTIPRFLLLLPCFVTLLTASPVVRAEDEATRIFAKVRQLDLLNQLLPVLMTTDQIKKLLSPIEKSRAAAIAGEKAELVEMKKIEARLDTAIKDAKEKSLVPSREFQAEVILLFQGFAKTRESLVNDQNDLVLKAVEENLDAGQIKAAANALTIPGGDGSKISDREKLRRWVRLVLMDPLAYDLLVEMSKKQ